MRNQVYLACYALLFCSLFSISCRKENHEIQPLQGPVENFNYAVNGTNVKLSWDQPAEIFDHYEIQLSKTEDFTVVNETRNLDNSVSEYSYYKLAPAEVLYARIRMVSKQTGSTSDWSILKFSTDQNNLLHPIADSDISGNTVTLGWHLPTDLPPGASSRLTRISIKPIIGEARDIMLSQQNISDRFLKVHGIDKDMRYTVTLYDGNFSRGVQLFTTLAQSVNGTWTLHSYSNLQGAIANSKNGDRILLKSGIYDLSNVILPITNKSILIQAAENNAEKRPKLYARGFELVGSGLSISFIGLDISGARINEFKEELIDLPDHAWNNRLLTLSPSSSGFDKVIFKDCIVRNYASGIFTASDNNRPPHKQGNLVSIENCIIYETGKNDDACLIEINAAELKAATITNSTFYKANKMLIKIDAEKNTGNNIINFLYKNNTADHTWAAGAFDFKALKAPARVSIENSIFSNIACINNVFTNFAFTANTFHKKLTHTNFYKVTSKATIYGSNQSNMPVHSWELRHPNTQWNEVLPGFIRNDATHINPNSIKEYPVNFDPGYLDPLKINFKISSGSPVRSLDSGKPIGDPRWW